MKKLRTTLAAFLLLLIAMPVLQSCLDDWDDDERSSLTIGTVRIIDGKDYYFALDEGTRMFPGDTAQVNNYTLVEGQRFCIFQLAGRKGGWLRLQCQNQSCREYSYQRHLLHARRKSRQYR